MDEAPKEFQKECRFDWYTSGMTFSSLRITHLKSGLIVDGSTHEIRFKLQRKLLKEIWQKWEKMQNPD